MKRLGASFKRYIKYYLLFWKFAFNLQFAYRFDTFVIIISVLSYNILDFLFYKISVDRLTTLGGWSVSELIVLAAVANLFWMVVKILYENNFEVAIEKINSGDYDFYLLKPISIQYMSFFFPPDFIKISFLPLVVFFMWLANHYDSSVFSNVDVWSILNATISFSYMVVINYCLSLIVVTMSFYAERVDQILSFFDKMQDFMKYPLEIFQGFFKIFLGVILPVGLFSGVPAKILLGKVENVPQTLIQYFGLTIVFVIISQVMWRAGLRRYSSASS